MVSLLKKTICTVVWRRFTPKKQWRLVPPGGRTQGDGWLKQLVLAGCLLGAFSLGSVFSWNRDVCMGVRNVSVCLIFESPSP